MVISLPTSLVAQRKSQFQEGLWEYRVKMEIPGVEVPEVSFEHCTKKEDYVPKTQTSGAESCRELKRSFDGRVATWQMECTTEGGKYLMEGKALYQGNTMQAELVGTSPEGKIIHKMTGRRKGPCPRR